MAFEVRSGSLAQPRHLFLGQLGELCLFSTALLPHLHIEENSTTFSQGHYEDQMRKLI